MSTPTEPTRTPRRVVIVGASSGLGRCVAAGLGAKGDRLALLARRKDRLDEAAAEAGPDAASIACDVTDTDSVNAAIDEAATTLGGIDALVYASGIGHLQKMADVSAETWAQQFATNVTGAAITTAAALPHLEESSGVALYFTSVSASMTEPWPGLGSYAVSKAALDKMVEAWRAEHPHLGFTRVIIGDCGGGEGGAAVEFNAGWDRDVAMEVVPGWVERQLIIGALMDVDELVTAVDTVITLGGTATIPSVAVMPRRPRPE
ncbi:SDR family NAD(P)-dependent oxidoreductase [Aquihabitans sp. McL0605]|uniref:SDR family NAD(P)-dependent oxidoreductase n=1 Tax=Aquihabitans sp. McL0605 TaxID=3415671 RepID=UPI003CEAB22B